MNFRSDNGKRKLPAMHAAYGISPARHKCRECCNFRRYTDRGKQFFKCIAYGETAGNASDWGANFLACGLFNVPADNLTPLIEIIHQRSGGRKKPAEVGT